MEKSCSKSFSDASNSSEIIKQINTLKPFDMEPRNAVTRKHLVSEEENN